MVNYGRVHHLRRVLQGLTHHTVMYHGLLMSKHRDGIDREPWATGRVSTSEVDWLSDQQGKDFTLKPSLFSRIINKIKKISTEDVINSLRIF